MSPSVQDLGRRVVVAMIGIAAGTEASASAFLAFHDGRTVHAVVWSMATVIIAAAATNIENVKVFLVR